MKIIAFSAYLSAIASASASSFQVAQRLRGNQEARELQGQECALERSTIADCARILVPGEQAFRPTSYTAGFAIDRTVENWGDLSCGIPMWEAGNPEKTLASHAFLNWDCSTSELCILVKADDGFSLFNEFWFKDYSLGPSKLVPIVGKEVQTILNSTSTTNEIIAWEACYSMVADCSTAAEIHANFDVIGGAGGRTTSTGKTQSLGPIALDLTCPCTVKDNCVINACYEPSMCVATTRTNDDPSGTCEYRLTDDNCCAGDADCDSDSTCVGASADGFSTATAGTCQYRETTTSTTKAPVTGGGGGSASTTTTPALITDECTDASECNLDSLSQGSEDCAAPICNLDLERTSGNTCGIISANQGELCDETAVDDKDEGNTCFIRNECSGFNCIATYKGANHECDGPANDPFESNFECVDYKCLADPEDSTRTTCEAVPKSTVTACNRDIESRGKCDSGDKCDGKGVCSSTYSYKPSNTTCRKSVELCDAPEYCTGDKHTCPEDKNYGEGKIFGEYGAELTGEFVCRPVCENEGCKDDIEEVCPGGTNVCPDDVIFKSELDLIAGQHNNAGSTEINATDLGNGSTQVCVTIYLDDAWALQSSDDPIKMEVNTEGGIRSSPGSYSYKDLVVGEKSCYTFSNDADKYLVYFALHLDVQKVGEEGSAETAWAKAPIVIVDETAASTATATSLTSQPFVKQGTKSGPKVKVTTTTTTQDGVGWGEYLTFSINCANIVDETCNTSTIGGGTTTTGTTVAPGAGTEASATITYTCTNGTDSSTAELTCQHNDVDENCHHLHNLFK